MSLLCTGYVQLSFVLSAQTTVKQSRFCKLLEITDYRTPRHINTHTNLNLQLINVEYCSTRNCNATRSILLRVFSKVCHNALLSIATTYGSNCRNMYDAGIELQIRKSFVDTCIIIVFFAICGYLNLCSFTYVYVIMF